MQNPYQNALDIQGACNILGITKSFAKDIQLIADEITIHRPAEYDTSLLAQHPVTRLYLEQITWLCTAGTVVDSAVRQNTDYSVAHGECVRMAPIWEEAHKRRLAISAPDFTDLSCLPMHANDASDDTTSAGIALHYKIMEAQWYEIGSFLCVSRSELDYAVEYNPPPVGLTMEAIYLVDPLLKEYVPIGKGRVYYRFKEGRGR